MNPGEPSYPPLFLPRLPRTPRKLSLDPSPYTSPAQPSRVFKHAEVIWAGSIGPPLGDNHQI